MTRNAFAGLLVIAGGVSATIGLGLVVGVGGAMMFGGLLVVVAGLVLARVEDGGQGG